MSIYFAVTLDPLHIGTGGYRLGRVDNTIIRDAGSNLPKIPGSSLAGVTRAYMTQSILNTEGDDYEHVSDCVNTSLKYKNNCGQCLICKLFGHGATDENHNKSHIGLLHFYDGNIVAFPVSTYAGPVWLTSPSALSRVLPSGNIPVADEEALLVDEELQTLLTDADNPKKTPRLNAGWLYLESKADTKALQPLKDMLGEEQCKRFRHLALAPDWLFQELVNSNLEVRTSVSINPLTGAAEDGKLFTSEAIPAATLLAFEVSLDRARYEQSIKDQRISDKVNVEDMLNNAFKQCELLGMGGMCTRGFGRLRIRKCEEAQA